MRSVYSKTTGSTHLLDMSEKGESERAEIDSTRIHMEDGNGSTVRTQVERKDTI